MIVFPESPVGGFDDWEDPLIPSVDANKLWTSMLTDPAVVADCKLLVLKDAGLYVGSETLSKLLVLPVEAKADSEEVSMEESATGQISLRALLGRPRCMVLREMFGWI